MKTLSYIKLQSTNQDKCVTADLVVITISCS